MKKNYIAPSILEFHFEGQPILGASTLDSNSDNPNVTPDADEVIDGGFGSRRRSQWEDEEEDDY